MKSLNDQQYLGELLQALESEQLAHIDFDHLRHWLIRQRDQRQLSEAVQSELELLREDYRGRIRGMVKALAVADRKRQAMRQADDLIATLEEMPSAELVKCYGRTAIRLRDMFPASGFNYLGQRVTSGAPKSYEDYK